MTSLPHIRYCSRAQIDASLWDACIDRAANGRIYAYSFYLDAMADNWDALIMGNYEAVMPLPWRRKWKIHYVYQPAFCAQLGVFGTPAEGVLMKQWLYALPKKFRLAELSFNQQNQLPQGSWQMAQRVNYVLSLQLAYEALYAGYRENIRRNIKKCFSYGCSVQQGVALNEIITIAKTQEAGGTTGSDFRNFAAIAAQMGSRAEAWGIRSARGELLASAVFLQSHRRWYYLLVGNHPNGRTMGASHALIDAFIKAHAGSDALLDFEGSDLRNLAFFYSSFGATAETYPALRWNRLPFWMRWMKG